MGLSWRIRANSDNERHKRKGVQLKGCRAIERRPGSCYRALSSPGRGIGSPYRPSVPLTGALVNCLIVGHSVWGAFKGIGLDRI